MSGLGAIGQELWAALPVIVPHITQVDKLWAFILCRSWETYILSDTLLRDLMYPKVDDGAAASERRERSKASWRMAMRTSMTNREWIIKILGLLEYYKEGGAFTSSGRVKNIPRNAAKLGKKLAETYDLFGTPPSEIVRKYKKTERSSGGDKSKKATTPKPAKTRAGTNPHPKRKIIRKPTGAATA